MDKALISIAIREEDWALTFVLTTHLLCVRAGPNPEVAGELPFALTVPLIDHIS
jgi:hypothetical protein